jgi:hypothetical protein
MTLELDELAAKVGKQIAERLANDNKGRTAETRKVHERLGSDIALLRRLLGRRTHPLPPEIAARVRASLNQADEITDQLEHAWYVSDALRSALLDVADDAYLETLLEQEIVRDRRKDPMIWSNYLERDELVSLRKAIRSRRTRDLDRSRAVAHLLYLYEKRRDDGAHFRARARMQARALLGTAAALAPLILALGGAAVIAGDVEISSVVLTGLAGGIGSMLTGARALRGAIRLNDLRALSAWSVLQPFVGAAAALLLLLVLQSQILLLPGLQEGERAFALATYGFLAGFSEPFFLGVVARIAGIGQESRSPSEGQSP